jgi:hypothetical protein
MIEPRLTRILRRTKVAVALAALALAASACGKQEDPQGGPDGGQGVVDAGISNDNSTRPDASAEPDSGGQPPLVDAGARETALPADGTDDSNDASSDSPHLDIALDSLEPGDGGMGDALDIHDSAEPTDGGIVDARDAPLDSIVGTADASDAAPVPIFSECTYVASMGGVPDLIVDATLEWPSSVSTCACTVLMHATVNRVLCGPALASIELVVGCSLPPQRGQRSIWFIKIDSCTFPTPIDGGMFNYGEVPLTNWDALLAEQIAGHYDAGAGLDAGGDGGSGDAAGEAGGPSDDGSDSGSQDGGTADGGLQEGGADG